MKNMEMAFKGLEQFAEIKPEELKQTIGGDSRRKIPGTPVFFGKK
ncbi:hypothetical protein AB1I63_08225 [Streptococcus pneumoniae]